MKFKQMMIVCDDIEKLRTLYFDECVNAEYVVNITDEENMYEIAKDELEIMQIGDTVILSVSEFCSVKDMIGVLKVYSLNAIALESLNTTYNKQYIGFKTLNELVDFVINKNKKINFIEKTVKQLSLSGNDNLAILSELSSNDMVLPEEIRDIFIF